MGLRSRKGRAGRGAASVLLLCALHLPLCGVGCAGSGGSQAGASAAESPREERDPDPWETANRGIFWFNEKLDIYLIGPVAIGWRFVTPSFFRKALTNVSDLMFVPVIFANDVLQLKPANAGFDILRFGYNLTFGIGGLIDIATVLEIPKNDEDFGQTLGYWGMPAGPYLVLPLFGPANVRDGIGRGVDATGTLYFSLLPFWVSFIVQGTQLVNLRSRYIEEIAENRRESFDYYVFMRDAYMQNRRAKIDRALDRRADPEEEEDLYFFDDDEDDLEDEDELLDEDAPAPQGPEGGEP
jgi:phospholipid-binding lipoprotein MlaA